MCLYNLTLHKRTSESNLNEGEQKLFSRNDEFYIEHPLLALRSLRFVSDKSTLLTMTVLQIQAIDLCRIM